MNHIRTIFLVLVVAVSAVTCSSKIERPDSGKDDPVDPVNPVAGKIALTPFEELNQGTHEMNSHAGVCGRSSIKRIESTLKELSTSILKVDYPNYPRIRVLPDKSYFLTWQQAASASDGNGLSVIYAKSTDLVHWTHKGYLFKREVIKNFYEEDDSRNYTNGNAIVLPNGELMAIGSYRTVKTYVKEDRKCDHGVVAKFSKDGGETWYDQRQIYTGPNWEPHLIVMPDGEIQCYIVNPRPWISSGHSGTVLITSKDNGRTWTPEWGEPLRHVMRSKYRAEAKNRYLFTDQMPVGVLLNGTEQFAFAVEAVRSFTSSKMVHATDIVFSSANGWVDIPDDEETEANNERVNGLDNNCDGIGPYLVQFQSGETVVTYTKGSNSMLHARVGNETAKEWQKEGEPCFPKYGGWSSCEMESDHTMLMVNKYSQDGKRGLVLARFALNHDIAATARIVKADGKASEWKNTDDAIFLNTSEHNWATLRCSKDSDNISFLMEISDWTLAKQDKIVITVSPVAPGDVAAEGALKFTFNPEGLLSVRKFIGGWKTASSNAVIGMAVDGTIDDSTDTDNGYVIELSIPRSEFSVSGEISLTCGLYDSATNKTDNLTNAIHVTNL